MTPTLRWLFARAFGPYERVLEFSPPRTPPEILWDEFGEGFLRRISEWFEATAVQVASLRMMLRGVAETASSLDIPLVVLKGMALDLAGIARSGSRPMSDVDVLVPAEAAKTLFEVLEERGFRSPFDEHYIARQHLRPLCNPHGFPLEIHFRLHGLRTEDGGDAVFRFFEQSNLLEEIPDWPRGTFLPDRALLIAHVVAHGLGTHLGTFNTYAPARVLCDLADLARGGALWEEFLFGSSRLVGDEVGRADVRAVTDLIGRLRDGEDPQDVLREGGGPAAVLGHLTAVCHWPRYRMRFLLRRRFRSDPRSLLLPRLPPEMSLPARLSWHIVRPFRVVPKFVVFSAGQVLARFRR